MHFHYDRELDLHGQRAEDALRILKSCVFSARHGESIMIIHGRGTGVLRELVREFLASCPCVTEWHKGENINLPGADGVSIAYIR